MEGRAFDELWGSSRAKARAGFEPLARWLAETPAAELARRQHAAETAFRSLGITFSVYGEEEAAEFIGSKMSKPVVSYIAGVTAPPGKKMGHAGAIVSGGKGTAAAKMDALKDAGAQVALNPTEAGELMVGVVAKL